jgi:methylthioxylose transferase
VHDPIGALHATNLAYHASLARLRPYGFWVLGSPTAWALAVGPPIVLACVAGARRHAPAATALVAVVAIAAVGGYTKAETERIWLPFVPLACVAAAEAGLASRRPRAVLVLLLAEAIVTQALFYTVW